jgi:hypothetical protein
MQQPIKSRMKPAAIRRVLRRWGIGKGRLMSTRFWLTSATAMGVAAVIGFGLGSFAVRTPATRWDGDPPALATSVEDLTETESDLRGPVAVHCTGCGPTLAERDRAKDLAGADMDGMIGGTTDPVVRDYLAEDVVPQPVPPPSPALAPMAERLVAAARAGRSGAGQPVVGQPAALPTGPLPVVGAPTP